MRKFPPQNAGFAIIALMLKDEKTFSRLERTLRSNGTLGLFEEEQGLIRRRMMITEAEMPEEFRRRAYAAAFEASFDCSDTTLSIVIDTETCAPLSNMWPTAQNGGEAAIDPDEAEAFVRALVEAVLDISGYSLPVYTFLSDFGHYSICPGR